MHSTRRSSFASFSALAILALVAACGDDGPGAGPLTAQELEPYCQKTCEREKTCNPTSTETVEQCVSECSTEAAGWARGDALAEMADCVADLACTAEEDTCLAGITPLDAHRTYETRCREIMATCLDANEVNQLCEVDAQPDGSGDAGFIRFITPSIVEDMTACFDQGCEAALACLQGVLEAAGVDF